MKAVTKMSVSVIVLVIASLDLSMGDVTQIGFFLFVLHCPRKHHWWIINAKILVTVFVLAVAFCCISIDDKIQIICFCICTASPKETKVCTSLVKYFCKMASNCGQSCLRFSVHFNGWCNTNRFFLFVLHHPRKQNQVQNWWSIFAKSLVNVFVLAVAFCGISIDNEIQIICFSTCTASPKETKVCTSLVKYFCKMASNYGQSCLRFSVDFNGWCNTNGIFCVCAASTKEAKPSGELVKYFCTKACNSVCACRGILWYFNWQWNTNSLFLCLCCITQGNKAKYIIAEV